MKRLITCSLDVSSWMDENDMQFTTSAESAIYLTPQGKFISGNSIWSEDGYGRDIDHRVIESLVNRSRYDEGFWESALHDTGFVMIIPENKQYLMIENQRLTDIQEAKLHRLDDLGWGTRCRILALCI